VIDGYQARRSAEVPAAWLERHSVSHWSCPTSPLPAPLP
jgi:hypothetical protein